MNKKFILLGHRKRQGKDTFANMLKEHLGDAKILSFAYPMKKILSTMKGLSMDEFENLKNSDAQTRLEIQRFGQVMKEWFGEDVWKTLVEVKAFDCKEKYIIVSDFRFPNEYIDNATTIKIVRDMEPSGDDHISETALVDYTFDLNIYNTGSLEDLNKTAFYIAEELLDDE